MANIFDLQKATRSARERCSDASIGTQVRTGKLDIVRVAYDKRGRSTVTPLYLGLTLSRAIDVLNRMTPEILE